MGRVAVDVASGDDDPGATVNEVVPEDSVLVKDEVGTAV